MNPENKLLYSAGCFILGSFIFKPNLGVIMFKTLIEELKKHKVVGVYSHIRPDADCIGAQIAVCRWLEKMVSPLTHSMMIIYL